MIVRNDLVPLKKVKTLTNFGVFDIESKKGTWDKFDFAGTFYNGEYKRHDTVEDLLNEMLDLNNAVTHRVFYAHNLDYDGMFLLNVLKELEEYKITPIIANRMLSLNIKKGRHTWKINDSYALLPHSLKKLMLQFKTSVTKESLNNIDKRNYSDCVGLYEILDTHFSKNLNHVVSLSQASTYMNIFRSKYLTTNIVENDKATSFIRSAYYGGRTEIFNFNVDPDKKFYLYDVNSLYPSVMKGKPYPVGKLKRYPARMINEVEGIALAIIENKRAIPILPVKEQKMFFRNGKIKGWYCLPELRYMIKKGQSVNILTLLGTNKTAFLFDSYINYYYSIKKESKGNDPIAYLNCKLAMNSLYGKFGQNTKKTITLVNPEEYPSIYLPVNDDHSIIKYDTESRSSFIKPLLSAYVTSYSRVKMLEYIDMLEEDIIYYMDTDSLYLSEEKLENSKQLGKMELEKKVKGLQTYLPKIYYYEGGIKCKGISIYNRDLEGNPEIDYKRVFSFLKGDEISYKAGLRKFKSMYKKQDWLETNVNKKTLKAHYDKRIIDGSNTYPFITYKPMKNKPRWDYLRSVMNDNFSTMFREFL